MSLRLRELVLVLMLLRRSSARHTCVTPQPQCDPQVPHVALPKVCTQQSFESLQNKAGDKSAAARREVREKGGETPARRSTGTSHLMSLSCDLSLFPPLLSLKEQRMHFELLQSLHVLSA